MASAVSPAVAEMRGHLVALLDDGPRKPALWRLARALGLAVGRVESIYYRKARRIDAEEADKIRARARAARVERLERLKARYETERLALLALAEGDQAALDRIPGPLADGDGGRP